MKNNHQNVRIPILSLTDSNIVKITKNFLLTAIQDCLIITQQL
ncbi:hypothetical protein N44_02127 [Microcystis aeruginosa NIES-44]|uniref:Uncharacterized protein n=1 Tax=Microcystis aeruginosa NIES-44 TaxID=449439 RepID=A0A0A1VUS8_MICAE|nr:hypothetical protein N44_02127 [Microcystis aeruginosa NIES-44]